MKTATATALALGLLSLPSTATACGVCMFAAFDSLLPHVFFWSIGMAIWFFAVMIICSAEKELSITRNPSCHYPTAIMLVFMSFLLGSAYLGPLPFGLLGLMTVFTTAKGFRQHIWSKLSKSSQRGLKVVSATAAIFMLAGSGISTYAKITRSDVDFILQWENTYEGKFLFQRLISESRKNEAQLRLILEKTKDKHLAEEITQAFDKMKEEKQESVTDAQ